MENTKLTVKEATAKLRAKLPAIFDEDWNDEEIKAILNPAILAQEATEKELVEKALTDHGYTDLSYRIAALDEIEKTLRNEGYNNIVTSILDDGRSVEIYGGEYETLVYIYPVNLAEVNARR